VFSSPGVPDHEWRRKHTYERFVVAYDPYDFGSVRLYTKAADGSLRFERVASPYVVIHRALQDQESGEAAFIRQEQAANLQDRVERAVAGREIEIEHGTSPEQHGLRTAELKGVPSEVQRQIDRRLERYGSPPVEETELGRRMKTVSLADWLSASEDEDEELSLPEKVPASKLAGML